MPLALIDGDILRYRIGFACEKTFYDIEYDDELYTFRGRQSLKDFAKENSIEDVDSLVVQKRDVVEPEEYCLHSLKRQVEFIRNRTNSKRPIIYLTGKGNFREEIATLKPYKGNRPDRKPVHYPALTEYLIDFMGAEVIDGMEADDALAIMQSNFPDTIICSIDKDLLQVPGEHFNFVKDEFITIEEDEGVFNLYCQILSGDSTDNIPGIRGYGEKKSRKYLKDYYGDELGLYKACRELYVATHKERGEDILTEVANLVYIKRHEEDYWSPPDG